MHTAVTDDGVGFTDMMAYISFEFFYAGYG